MPRSDSQALPHTAHTLRIEKFSAQRWRIGLFNHHFTIKSIWINLVGQQFAILVAMSRIVQVDLDNIINNAKP